VHAGFFFKTQSWREFRKDKTFKVVEGGTGSLCTKTSEKRRKLGSRRLSTMESHLVTSCRSPHERKRQTIGILCGESMKSHELSDLTKE
jgi:hypothetical protein